MSKKNFLNFVIIFFLGGVSVLYAAAQPKFSIIPTTTTDVLIPRNDSVVVQYRVTNNTQLTRTLTMVPIEGISSDRSEAGFCSNPFTLNPGESCLLTLPIIVTELQTNRIVGGPVVCKTQNATNNNPNPFLCSQPSQENILRVLFLDFITVSPDSLAFIVGSTGEVTVTNLPESLLSVKNISAYIPSGSSIFIYQNNCPPALAPGASCTIVFSSNSPEGPTTVAIAGDNSNTVNIEITASTQPVISLTAPAEQERIIDVGVGELDLVITNNTSSPNPALNVDVTNQSSCPDVVVTDTGCASVAPGGSCTLHLSSPTPYVPCNITIAGSNTGNSITTLIAFRYLGGLVYQTSGGGGQIVRESEFATSWTVGNSTIPDASSSTNGEANTNVIVADGGCIQQSNNCAAQRCRNLGLDWYLPAYQQISNFLASLCPNRFIPCQFGGFTETRYWSSTYNNNTAFQAYAISSPSGTRTSQGVIDSNSVRCTRNF